MTAIEAIVKTYHRKLSLAILGSVQCYLGVTREFEEEGAKDLVWAEYNKEFDDLIMRDLIQVFDRHNCGVGERAHAALKLLDLVAPAINAIEHLYPCQKGGE